VQAIYVPADDLTDPAPATTFAHLDATTVLSRQIAELGIYPAVDPLDSTSRMLDPLVVGEEHYRIARAVQKVLQDYKSLQDIIAILGMDDLGEEDKQTVYRARRIQKFMAQPFQVAEAFTGMTGKFVSLEDNIASFKAILEGKYDHLPETAFYMVGAINEVEEKAKMLAGKADTDDKKKKVAFKRTIYKSADQLITALKAAGRRIQDGELKQPGVNVEENRQRWDEWEKSIEADRTRLEERFKKDQKVEAIPAAQSAQTAPAAQHK